MILAVVGPTGIGKSEIALELSRWIGAEIVAVDSMQVYRGMDLGTGKPDISVRKEIPHHGLDLVEPEEEFNAVLYAQLVRPSFLAIQERGSVPLLVGGSGLYLRALLDGLCPATGKDAALREQLLAEAQEEGGAQLLYERLKKVDPPTAAKIHPNNFRRTVRALEVFLVTGSPLSQWQKQAVSSSDPVRGQRVQLVGLTCDRASLYRRIEKRIEGWLQAGWLEEARGLSARPLSQTAREALGYRELFQFLDGRTDWETTCQLIKRNTCRYAKRQWTWFKADSRIVWIQTDRKMPEAIAKEIGIRWNVLSS